MVIRAEVGLIGSALIDPDVVDKVAPIVDAADFDSPRWREVWAAMLALRSRGIAVDYVTVCCELEARGSLTTVKEYNLTDSVNCCPTSLHATHYARTVAGAARERRRSSHGDIGALPL